VAQRLFGLLTKSLPKSIENIYAEDFKGENLKNFEKLDEKFMHEYELYMKTVQKQDEYLLLYRVGIKRDDTEWMENIANKVGLTLPKKNSLNK
jgi:hypothetical protein